MARKFIKDIIIENIHSMMKTSLIVAAILCVSFFASAASNWKVDKENLTYDVMYKWGIINKKAGSVSLKTSGTSQPEFKSILTASTAPWAEKIYSVRDTLLGTIASDSFLPSRYERIAHEGGRFSHDILEYTRAGNSVQADAQVWRNKKKEAMTFDKKLHQAEGTTLDMLSSFYFMRSLNFDTMKPGDSVKMNIFSGKKKEFLTIHYQGTDNEKIGKQKYPCYHITFTFTQEGGKISSDNMDAWISTESRRIPLLLEGKLPVGKVRAVYSGSTENL